MRKSTRQVNSVSNWQKAMVTPAILIPPITSSLAYYQARHQPITEWITLPSGNLSEFYFINLVASLLLTCLIIATRLSPMSIPALTALAATVLAPIIISLERNTLLQIALTVLLPITIILLSLLGATKFRAKSHKQDQQGE